MGPQLDVGKLVGAASAPVALIIATCIFLGNLGGKYSMLVNMFREATREYRQLEEAAAERRQSLEHQIELYAGQLRHLIRATFALGVALQCFILTVMCTSLSVIFSGARIWLWVTGFFSFAGMLIFSASIVTEMVENHHARRALLLEIAGFPIATDLHGENRR